MSGDQLIDDVRLFSQRTNIRSLELADFYDDLTRQWSIDQTPLAEGSVSQVFPAKPSHGVNSIEYVLKTLNPTSDRPRAREEFITHVNALWRLSNETRKGDFYGFIPKIEAYGVYLGQPAVVEQKVQKTFSTEEEFEKYLATLPIQKRVEVLINLARTVSLLSTADVYPVITGGDDFFISPITGRVGFVDLGKAWVLGNPCNRFDNANDAGALTTGSYIEFLIDLPGEVDVEGGKRIGGVMRLNKENKDNPIAPLNLGKQVEERLRIKPL